jgi:hypothetical protein
MLRTQQIASRVCSSAIGALSVPSLTAVSLNDINIRMSYPQTSTVSHEVTPHTTN